MHWEVFMLLRSIVQPSRLTQRWLTKLALVATTIGGGLMIYTHAQIRSAPANTGAFIANRVSVCSTLWITNDPFELNRLC
ncbi:MAG: hypothetical protein MUF72_15100 [Elainella sp. Prado103]|nr:hypothetical protein [Elainella sp. Prado103]